MEKRLGPDFYTNDVLEVAPALLGKTLVRICPEGNEKRLMITETEAYRGEEDLACHARMGRTARNEIMYSQGGFIYMYLIYGMYWMINVVAGQEGTPQAALIRGLEKFNGPGKLSRYLEIDKSFNGENLITSQRLYIVDNSDKISYSTSCRIGIDYAGDIWKNKPWRFTLIDSRFY